MNPVDDFLMEKEAIWGSLRGLGGRMGSGFVEAIPGAFAGAAVAGVGALAAKGWGAAKSHINKTKDYERMVKSNPALKKMDAGQVQMTYNSLRTTAPDLAGDPLLAGSFVRRTIESSPESGAYVDPMTVKTLSEAQRNISSARNASSGSNFSMQTGAMRGADLWMSRAPYGASLKGKK